MATDGGPTPSRIVGLDALRGMAALGVFVCHIAAYWPSLRLPRHVLSLSQVGAHGVDVFVVLSGFVLTTPFVGTAARQLRVRDFWARRAWRILPAYWVALAIAAPLAMSSLYGRVVAERATWADLAPHVVGLQTWFPRTLGTINGSLWSISLELSLYLVFPALLALRHRAGAVVVLGGSAALCLAWWFAGTHWQITSGPFQGLLGEEHVLPMRLVQFAVGMWLAEVLIGRGVRRPGAADRRTAMAVAACAVVLGVTLSTVVAPEGPVIIAWGFAGASLIWLFAACAEARWMQPLESFGRRSFSFYLIHQPVVLLLAPVVAMLPEPWELRGLLGAAIALVAVCAAAEILYRGVELPSHRFSRRRYASAAPRPSSPSPVLPQSAAVEESR